MARCLLRIIPPDARTLAISNLFPSKTLISFHRSPVTPIIASSAAPVQGQYPPSPRIFIKGLPLSTNEGFLRKTFSQFGEVSEVKIARSKASQSLGYAFVSYFREEDAQSAVNEMNGKVYYCRNWKDCKPWHEKNGNSLQVLMMLFDYAISRSLVSSSPSEVRG